jgi:hypothetical protein
VTAEVDGVLDGATADIGLVSEFMSFIFLMLEEDRVV